jgi:uncharacterized protein (UPF0305 family)
MASSFVNDLMELKRKADLTGRPVSQREVAGASEGYFRDMANRNYQSRQLSLAEQQQKQNQANFTASLLQRQSEMAAQMDAARKARQMGLLNTGVGAGLGAGMLYYL